MTLQKHPPSDLDRQIAICRGMGLSIEATAEHLDIAINTVRNHLAAYPDFIAKVQAETEAAASRVLAAKIDKVVAPVQDRVKRMFERGLTLSEKAIEKAEQIEDPSLAELIEIHKTFTMWAAKFSVSEAPKRLEMAGKVEHEHKVIPDEAVQRLTAFMQKHTALLPQGEVIDVEPIADA